MDTFGRFRLAFEPAGDDMAPSVEMTISGEADLSQMASFFDSFLKANGYIYEGNLEIVSPEPKKNTYDSLFIKSESTPFDTYDFGDDGFSLVGNPFAAPDTISFAGVQGGLGQDVISF